MPGVEPIDLDELTQAHAAWLDAVAVLRDGRGEGMSSIIAEEEKRAVWDAMFTAKIRDRVFAAAFKFTRIRSLFDARRDGRCDPDLDADDWLTLIAELLGDERGVN